MDESLTQFYGTKFWKIPGVDSNSSLDKIIFIL